MKMMTKSKRAEFLCKRKWGLRAELGKDFSSMRHKHNPQPCLTAASLSNAGPSCGCLTSSHSA